MKKLIILLLIIPLFLKAQDFLDPKEPLIFNFKDPNTGTLVSDSLKEEYFPSDMILGWQWGFNARINEAMNMNMGQETNWLSPTIRHFSNNPVTNYKSKAIYGLAVYNPLEAQGIVLEPTLNINSPESYEVRDNAIFGFQDISGTITNNANDPNYGRLVLKQTDMATYPMDSIVLKNAWNLQVFMPYGYDVNSDKAFAENLNHGYEFYLTINLRRLDSTSTASKTNDTVLTIRIPYKYKHLDPFYDTVEVIHNAVIASRPILDSIIRLDSSDFRGYTYKNEMYDTIRDAYIAITDEMLPNANDTLGKDITISFFFPMSYSKSFKIDQQNPALPDIYNHQLNKPWRSKIELDKAYDIDVQVKYHGKTDVAINYIRFENPQSKEVFEGEWDDRMQDGNQQMLSHLDTVSNYEFYRVYTEGGDDGIIVPRWSTQRYMSKLFNHNVIASMPPVYMDLWDYYVGARERWIPARSMRLYGQDIAAPYYRQQIKSPAWWNNDNWTNRYDTTFGFGFHSGYRGYEDNWGDVAGNYFFDTLRSDYELNTKYFDGSKLKDNQYDFLDSLRRMDNDTFMGFLSHSQGFLFAVEQAMGTISYEGAPYLFSNKPWYGQLFIDTKWDLNFDYFNKWIAIRDFNRTYTGEEISAMLWSNIILGVKGFIYDRMDSFNRMPDSSESEAVKNDFVKNLHLRCGIATGGGDYNTLCAGLSGEALLDCTEIGGDFLQHGENTNLDDYIDFNALAYYLSVPEDRIYVGFRSIRKKMAEIHKIMMENKDELMNMRFIAAYGKGIRTNYAQDINYEDSLLIKKIIDIDTNKLYTKRLFKRSLFDTKLTDPQDSTFFDISLLRNKDISIDSIFYIGVFNRRTDPRIHYQEGSEDYMKFLTTAEFRDSCTIGVDTALYNSYWWKRLGAREITIPFNYTYSDTNDYKLLRITELYSGSSILDTAWFFNEPFNDRIRDTVIGQDRSLSLKLLPGQGKILKVEVLKPDKIAGFLDNYNQTKLIEYTDPLTGMTTYHLVYYKNAKVPNDTTERYTEVHYIQSMPIAKNSDVENIVWNEATERNLSRTFLEHEDLNDTNYCDCNHPAIVVRDDSLGQAFAYVVYTCEDSAATYSDSARVVEAKIEAMSGALLSNQEIFKLSVNEIERYGTPVINASAKGNFIAWTDSIRGMFIAYQRPEEDVPSVIDSITPYQFDPGSVASLLYPSFNTYSKIENGENNAALVWWQRQSTGLQGIYYTRIFYNEDLGKIEKVISPNYVGEFLFTLDPNLEMMRVGYALVETKPIVYRDLRDYSTNPAWCIYNRCDNINWINTFSFGEMDTWFAYDYINSLSLMHQDTNSIPKKWAASTINTYIFGGLFSDIRINSINSAQADGILIDTMEVQAGGNYNLDFTVDSAEIYQLPGYNNSINMSEWLYGEEIVDYNKNMVRKAAHGNLVQLAKSREPNYNYAGLMWKNRRVFETSNTDNLGNPYILTSAKLFYKEYANEIINHGFLGFTGDSNNVYFDSPKLEGDFGAIANQPIWIDKIDPCSFVWNPTPQKDTFQTSTLNVPDYDNDGDREMQISMYGFKTSKVKVYLQRMSDLSLTLLTMPTTSEYPGKATKLIYSIIDSANSEFRLIYVNDDTTAHFNEKAFIYGMGNSDTISYKSANIDNSLKYIIDFNNGGSQYVANGTDKIKLKVYPNPTNGRVSVQAILPEAMMEYEGSHRDVVVSIYNSAGRKLYEQKGGSGQILEFDMSENPAGSYIINVDYKDDTHNVKAMSKLVKK